MKSGVILFVFACPLIIGVVVSVVDSTSFNIRSEQVEVWLRRKLTWSTGKSHWFYRYLLSPGLWMIVKVADWTDGMQHRGVKNGLRFTLSVYFAMIWALVVYNLAVLALTILVIGFIFYVLFKAFVTGPEQNTETHQSQDMPMRRNNLNGKEIYVGASWFNEELAGRVDDEGDIYSGSNWLNEVKIGRINKKGEIFRGANKFTEVKIGRIDEDGNLIKGTTWLNEEQTGRIDHNGKIYHGTNWLNERQIGRVN
jgi:hypothetical protein